MAKPLVSRPKRRVHRSYASGLSERLTIVCGEMSYAEFGRATGFNHETVRRYVQGQCTPPPEFLAQLCESFGYSPTWLLLGRGRARFGARRQA